MHDENAPRINYFGGVRPTQTLGPFRLEMPVPPEWDQLLAKLTLSDSQALEAVKSDGEQGERLRKFVFKSFTHHFVPEEVIKAASRRRKEKHLEASPTSQPGAIDSNAAATLSSEPA
jgi:hypothetical protein